MVRSQFGAILKELEPFFNCPLDVEDQGSCIIQMNIGITLQVELDRYGLILIGCRLGSIPMGRYRDNLIKAALKFNEATSPLTGIFGFSQKSNQLILFVKLNPQFLSNQYIATSLPPFITKAKQWTEAIAKGEVPTTTENNPKIASGLFGLIS